MLDKFFYHTHLKLIMLKDTAILNDHKNLCSYNEFSFLSSNKRQLHSLMPFTFAKITEEDTISIVSSKSK